MTEAVRHASFAAFYPFYLSEHNDRTCRRLHQGCTPAWM
jgi:hypothetical protein